MLYLLSEVCCEFPIVLDSCHEQSVLSAVQANKFA
jgi:hypothetical protein